MTIKSFFIYLTIMIIVTITNNALAYDDKFTHPSLTNIVSKKSAVEQYLSDYLGLKDGFETQFVSNYGSKSILKLLELGSTAEDKEMCRRGNHMHNPLKTWDVSYMDDVQWTDGCYAIWGPKFSNITWATSYLAPLPDGAKAVIPSGYRNSPYNWDLARNYYYQALIFTAKDNRDKYFAWTFKTIGHVLHLLQDVAVPAHTRNDFASHLIGTGVYWGDKRRQPYEYYVKANNTTLMESAFSEVTVNHDNNFPAFSNKKLTDYWDTDQYILGSNPSTLLNLGLAEFSNANYFSDYTIPPNSPTPKHQFPYPNISESQKYQICLHEITPGIVARYISRKNGKPCPAQTDTDQIDHFAAIGLLADYPEPKLTSYMWLDDNVHKTYANELLPRAVGYSAGLLDYFFRGKIGITAPDEYVYSIIDGNVTPHEFTKIKAKLSNTTENEAMTSGTIQAVAKYKVIPNYDPTLVNYPPDGETMKSRPYSYKTSLPITLTQEQLASINTSPTQFTFDFTNSPIPAGITDLYLQVIFKGTLGNEKDTAVAVGMKNLREPTHHVFMNATDMFMIDGQLYNSSYIKSKPTLSKKVDLDHDKIFNEISIGEPYIDPCNITFSLGYMNTAPPATPVINTASATVPWGRHIRVIALVDNTQTDNWFRFTHSDNIYNITRYGDYFFSGVTNQEENGVWQTPTPVMTLRGIKEHFYVLLVGCVPELTDPVSGEKYCPYPENAPAPADSSPFPVTIYFQ